MASTKMRIAMWHNLPSGGSKRVLYQQVEGLLARGHSVECWCPATASQNYLPLKKLCPEHALPMAWPAATAASRWSGWWREPQIVQARLKAMHEHCRAAAAQIERGGFDLLMVHTCAAFAVSPLGHYVKLPKLLFLGEPNRKFYEALPESVWAAPPPTASPLRVLANTFRTHAARLQVREEISNARQFDQVLVNSLFSRESTLRAYGLESEPYQLGIDTELFQPTGEPPENYIVGLGMVGYHKGIDRAIRALGAIPLPDRPRLIWVGNANHEKYLAELQALARDQGVAFEVKIMVKDAELVSLLSRAAVMLYTSRLEPFGLAPLEANACGAPVVAVPEGGIRETIRHGVNGLLAASAQPHHLAATLLELLKNPERAAVIRQQARAEVLERWRLESALDRLEAALAALVRSAKKQPH